MATMKKTTKTTAKPKLKKAQAGGYNDTSGKKKLGPALGIGIPVTGMVAAGANMIKNAVKRRKEKKASEERKLKLQSTIKAAREKATNVPKSVKKKGGVAKYRTRGIKKYQPGGPSNVGGVGARHNPVPPPMRNPTQIKPAASGERIKVPEPSRNARKSTDAPITYERNTSPYGPFGTAGPATETVQELRSSFNKIEPRVMQKHGGTRKAKYMTGGMVNPNAKVSALKKAGSKGVKPNVNPKATAAKRATGRTGGTSTAPRTAKPKKNK